MSAEYPPIIIDGTNFCEEPDAPSFSTAEALTIQPSLVSLYLIYDNQLIHQGDYKSEQIKLVWGDSPEQAMVVGGSTMTVDSSCVRQLGSGSTTMVGRGAKRVREIHVPTQQEPLLYQRDFHNFLIIVQRRG